MVDIMKIHADLQKRTQTVSAPAARVAASPVAKASAAPKFDATAFHANSAKSTPKTAPVSADFAAAKPSVCQGCTDTNHAACNRADGPLAKMWGLDPKDPLYASKLRYGKLNM